MQKLHLACRKEDGLRPTLEHIYIDKDSIVCSDGWILVKHKTKVILGKDFVEKLGDREIVVRGSDWKKLCKPYLSILLENNLIKIITRKGNELIEVKELKDCDFRKPNFDSVIPNEEEYIGGIGSFGLDPTKLSNLQQAMYPKVKNNSWLIFKFAKVDPELKAILVKPISDEFDLRETKAMIMPVKSNK